MSEVVVVGAGPAGASLALTLARQGVPVTLVEAALDPARQFRGEALMPHGLAALEAMGLASLLEAVPQRPLDRWAFCLDGQPLFEVAEPLEGPGHPPCTLVSQPALLNALLQALRQQPQARVRQGERVTALLQREGRISGVTLASGESLGAALVVACDGRRSSLRRLGGLTIRREASPIDVLWFRLPDPGLGSSDGDPLAGGFLTCVGKNGIFSAFRSALGELQLGWVLEPGSSPPALSPNDWLERMACQSPPGLAELLRRPGAVPAEPARLRVEVGLAPRWWRPGLLLLGDAAHPMSPVRAQGINLALRDACVAGRVLGQALHPPAGGDNTPALDPALARIEQLRRPETQALQALQRREASRGLLLRRQGVLRQLLRAGAPWLAPALAAHWRHSQQPLRQGLSGGLEPRQ